MTHSTTPTTSRALNQLAKTALTWNGALSYSTTGFEALSRCLDYWTKAGTFTARPQEAVDLDMLGIFADDEAVALRILFGLRLITRKPNVQGFEEVQSGYGRRDEFYKGIVWLHHHKPDLLYRNLHLVPVFGCWKDFMVEPLVDVLDRDKVYALARANLDDQLLRKYLPQITRSLKNVRSERDGKRIQWGRGLCAYLGIDQKQYRALKREGKAHIWQKQMAAREWDQINFNGIPGKAMLRHTSQKGKTDKLSVFERHGQVERLQEWVLNQKSVKFTGYPYDLTRAASTHKRPGLLQKFIYDKQFETLIEPMRNHKLGNVLACLDTSGSMGMPVAGDITAFDICVSMGVVFSSLNVGHFKDTVCAFDNESRLIRLQGGFCDRLHHIERMTTAWGSTNFQSVIDLLVCVRQGSPEVPVADFPETLLVISDMQFNPVGYTYVPDQAPRDQVETNYEAAMRKLKSVGLKDVRIIWWFVNGAGTDFPNQMNDKGVYMIGGFDPINIKALMGLDAARENLKDFDAKEKKEETPLDGMLNFLSQPIFALVE